MKFKITLKDPDGVYESIKDAAESSLPEDAKLSQDELEKLAESRREELEKACGKWFEYNECVTIEIDTDSMTATVCES